jgi:hypothetical protein
MSYYLAKVGALVTAIDSKPLANVAQVALC